MVVDPGSDPDSPSSQQELSREPLVSVVIPTYNSRELLTEALDALAAQTLPADQIQVVVVDDGSTDGTWALLERLAAERGNLTIAQQQHSGRPSVGRNRALDLATGRFLFFHDADDYLAADALRRMVEVAETEGADVVVGRIERIGPGTTQWPLSANVLDADLLSDGVWSQLSAQKLIRRSLIERLGVRFPEDMVQGEDQVFVATCLFSAGKISMLNDYHYYYRRRREDGANISRRPQSLDNKRLTTTRMARLITANTKPGARRELMFRRLLVGTLGPALGRTFVSADPVLRAEFLQEIQRDVLPHLTPRVLAKASDKIRLRLLVAATGTAEDLVELHSVLARSAALRVEDQRLVLDLGPRLNALVPSRQRETQETPAPPLPSRVVQVHQVPEGFSLGVSVAPAPDATHLTLVARLRDTGQLIEIDSAPTHPDGTTLVVRLDRFPRPDRRSGAGAVRYDQRWDLELQQRTADTVTATGRLSTVDELATLSRSWYSLSRARRLTASLYRTRYGNLTVRVEGGLLPEQLVRATVSARSAQLKRQRRRLVRLTRRLLR